MVLILLLNLRSLRMTNFKKYNPASKASIRDILMKNWDPIGVENEPLAQDEYDGYIGFIVSKLQADASVVEIADTLIEFESVRMGLLADKKRALKVAQILINYILSTTKLK
jgi:hypothetical protein